MEDQTLNPFRAPTARGQAPREQPAAQAVILSPVHWFRELPICLALVFLIGIAYWKAPSFEFVYFDDPGYVTDNLNVVRGLPLFQDPKGFRESVYWAFTAFEQSNWHPLTWLSHMLDVQLYGLEAGGHHVTNLFFHTCNTLLLFWLLRLLSGQSWPSAAVAALFAVHPMHVESVVWIAERKDVLSTFLGLLTLLTYVRYVRKAVPASDSVIVVCILSAFTWLLTLVCFVAFHVSGKPENFPFSLLWAYIPILGGIVVYAVAAGRYNLLWYCAIFVLYALGLLAKPMLVTLPFVCLLLDFWPLNRFTTAPAARPLRAAAERPAGPRRRAKRNQRLPARRAAAPAERGEEWPTGTLGLPLLLERALQLVFEKLPLFGLCAASAIVTPYAQAHGGSMASSAELTFSFRIENALQSYMTYITRLFWPGKMSVLYLLDIDHVDHFYTAFAVAGLLLITALVILGTYFGRRYLAVGWFWFLGTLVPVIGIMQVGEQTYADRYTYIPYVGLFIMLAWGVADLIELLPEIRGGLRVAAGFVLAAALTVCVDWTQYQLQFWTGVEVHLRHALTITPDNWNMLNNLGVYLWKQAQKQDALAGKADAEGDTPKAAEYHQKSVALKKDAMAQWIHGITARPTATDIHSNLGYAYSEAGDLDKAEWHLTRAVELKPISPRPRNNLGRVLLRRSQEREKEAREAEAKGADPAKVKALRDEAKVKLDAAIAQFEKAVELDPTLLEARLNLGEVYSMTLHDYEKAEEHYKAILALDTTTVIDRETISNFSQGWFGMARIAIARKNLDEAIGFLRHSLLRNPQNAAAMQMLAHVYFERHEYREGEKLLWPFLAVLPPGQRFPMADQFGGQFELAGKHEEAARAWDFLAWVFATSPEPHFLDPKNALLLAQRAVRMSSQQDPLSLDTLAAALAANGQFDQAAKAAQAAIQLANSKGNKPLAAAITERLRSYYLQGKPYRCDPDGGDRP